MRLLCFVALLACTGIAQEAGQKTFSSPQEAATALYDSVKTADSQAMQAVLGASSHEIVDSGDAVQDANAQKGFLSRFEQMSRIGRENDGSRVLYIGADNWPFPIPLKQTKGQWYFDTPAGKEEILFRRIGRNEYAAMRVLCALAEAQDEYYRSFQHYAQKLFSSEGQQDGLYWEAAPGQPQSPIGPLAAHAAGEGYARSGKPEPFHGYFFRILTAQGASARGGAKNYIENGQMTGGFAFVAYPAEHRSSGVMTFLIDKDGVLYEKDLGEKTMDFGQSLKLFNPDRTWAVVPEEELNADPE